MGQNLKVSKNNIDKTSKKNKFLLLCLGQFVASIGHGLSSFTLGVYVFDVSGSALNSSLVMLLGFLPTLALMIPAGGLADRYDRRLLMILGDGLSALGLIFILVFKLLGSLEIWHILLGVCISAIFQALMDPAFKATVSDLLTEDEYTKGSGLIQASSSAKFLLAPLLGGFLYSGVGLEIILLIDIFTVVLTVLASSYVRRGLKTKSFESEASLLKDIHSAWQTLASNRAILTLVFTATALTFFLAFLQTLINPFFLSFSNSETLGVVTSIAASGMLVSSIILGFITMKNHLKYLSFSLSGAAIAMGLTVSFDKVPVIAFFAFMFFFCLPFANSSLDYLVRTNIDNKYQGRVWALIGVISQLGYVFAYPLAGFLADKLFIPAFSEGGALAESFVSNILGTGAAAGIAFEVIIAAIFLLILSLYLLWKKSLRTLVK